MALSISIEAGPARGRDLAGAASEPRRLSAGLFAIHVRSFCRIQSISGRARRMHVGPVIAKVAHFSVVPGRPLRSRFT